MLENVLGAGVTSPDSPRLMTHTRRDCIGVCGGQTGSPEHDPEIRLPKSERKTRENSRLSKVLRLLVDA